MDMIMEASGVQDWRSKHSENIDEFCRICGSSTGIRIPQRNPASKEKFKDEIAIIYGIDLDNDKNGIHPKYICYNNCARKLRKYAQLQKEKKHRKGSKSSGDGLPVDREAFNFDSLHRGQSEEKCKVCELRRSPRKRSSAETCSDASVLTL